MTVLKRHRGTIGDLLVLLGFGVTLISADVAARMAGMAIASSGQLAHPGSARLFGISVLAAACAPVVGLAAQVLRGEAMAAPVIPALVLGWLIAMALPAALAADRSVRPLWWRHQRSRVAVMAGPMLRAYATLTIALGTLWITTTADDPLRVSVKLALLSATGVAVAAAVQQDRQRDRV